MLSNISDVIGTFDEKGILTYISPNVEKLYGWRPDEIIGTSSLSRVHPDDKKLVDEALQTLLKSDRLELTRIYRQKCKDSTFKKKFPML
jgi:PAS domain S-box-containing protein